MTTSILSNSLGAISGQAISKSQKQAGIYSKQLTTGRKNVESYMGIAEEALGNQIKFNISAFKNAKSNITQAQGLYEIAFNSYKAMQESFQKMYDIAQTATSGLLSDSERSLLNLEFQPSLDAIDNLAESATFGSTKLLNGMYGRKNKGPVVDKTVAADTQLIVSAANKAQLLSDAATFPNNNLADYKLYEQDGTTQWANFDAVKAYVTSTNAANLEADTHLTRFQVHFDPEAAADQRYTISAIDSTGEKHINNTTFLTDKLTKNTAITITLANSRGQNTFSFEFNSTTADVKFLDTTDATTTAAGIQKGHYYAQQLENLMSSAFFGQSVEPKIQIGSGHSMDLNLTQTNARMALEYKPVKVSTQLDAQKALIDVKTAIDNIGSYMSEAAGKQWQLMQALDNADTSLMQHNNSLMSLTAVDLSEAAINLTSETTKMQAAISTLQQSMQSFKMLGAIVQNL